MNSIEVTIKGISPLLMHRFPMDAQEGISKMNPQDQAELSAYRNPETKALYVPGVNIQRCMVKGAGFVKGKGRATLAKTAAACVFITPDQCDLGTKHFELDARPVVMPATKGRVIRYRARLDQWQIAFTLDYDDTLMSAKEIRSAVDAAGARVGLLDFRPEKGGPFGRFMVVSWRD